MPANFPCNFYAHSTFPSACITAIIVHVSGDRSLVSLFSILHASQHASHVRSLRFLTLFIWVCVSRSNFYTVKRRNNQVQKELQMERGTKCDCRLTEAGYEGVQKQTDDSQRERHCGYRSPQRSLLLPDLHHHTSTCNRGTSHGFGPKIVPGLVTPLLCSSLFLCHLSFFFLFCLV